MVSNFSSPIKGQNSGSSKALIDYLEKENLGKKPEEKAYFFNQKDATISPLQAIEMLDNNGKNQGLKKDQDRFYCLTINPSEKELQHIKNNPEKLRAYTVEIMENYARNFNKNIDPKSLVWVAKLENERKYTHEDKEVQQGEKNRGELKQGLQTHIHITVSRFTEKSNEFDRTISISPLTNHKNTEKGATKGGFNRVDFINANEKTFDEKFNYERQLEEKFDYSKASTLEKVEMIGKDKENALKPSFDANLDPFNEDLKGISLDGEEKVEEQEEEKDKEQELGFDFGMGMGM